MIVCIAGFATWLAVFAPSGSARADDTAGLDVASTSRYSVEPQASVVRARTTLTFTNTTVDQTVDTSVRRRYFTGFSFPVPVGSTSERATTADGSDIPIETRLIPGNGSFVLYSLTFPDPLFSGDRTTIEITYDITGMPPRSDDPSRVNPAYVAFTAYGIGDEGQASIEVNIPAGFEIDTFGDDDTLEVTTGAGGSTLYRVTAIPDPGEFALFVSARNDTALTSRSVTGPGGERFVVRSWPDDPDWQGFVIEQIDDGIPLLAELIERPWPIGERVEIRQAVTPYLYGYAGWFSAAKAELEVGEDLDPDTVLHELSHAWFNSRWFAERWASEGLAQVYTDSAVALLGGSPTPTEAPDPADPAAVALVDWGAPRLEQGADATETFGYAASRWVMQRIIEEVGFPAIADVIDAIEEGTLAYPGDATTPPGAGDESGPADWRRLLDLFEEVAGSTGAARLIAEHVARESDSGTLDDRAAARQSYAVLERAGGSWAPPRSVRQAMGRWDFESALDAIDEATGTLGRRDDLQELGVVLQIDLTSDLEVDYEDASSLDDLDAVLARRAGAAELIVTATDAVEADPGLIERLGLLGRDPAGDLETARDALARGDTDAATVAARRTVDEVDDAVTTGLQRAGLAAGSLTIVALVVLIVVGRRRRRRTRDQAADT